MAALGQHMRCPDTSRTILRCHEHPRGCTWVTHEMSSHPYGSPKTSRHTQDHQEVP